MDINAIVEKLTSTDLVSEEKQTINDTVVEESIGMVENSIKTITFAEYVEKYGSDFPNFGINRIKIKVGEEVNNDIIAFKSPKIKNPEIPDIYIMKNCDIMKVPDIKPYDIKIFKHDLLLITFDITSENDNVKYYMRSYVTKGGMKNILCVDVDGMIVPYSKVRVSKKNSNFTVNKINVDDVRTILSQKTESYNIESLIIRYPIARKVHESLKTNHDIVDWLVNIKMPASIDIVHHLKIDILILQIIFNLWYMEEFNMKKQSKSDSYSNKEDSLDRKRKTRKILNSKEEKRFKKYKKFIDE